MEKIAIIGTGLIGTSLGLAIKKAYSKDIVVVGMDLERGRADKAKNMGALDLTEGRYRDVVDEADIVFIATPIKAIREVMEAIVPDLREGCLVTDTGSTKGEVMKWAGELLPREVDFVGGHPMAGKETSGPDQADGSIFVGRPYCLIPDLRARSSAVQRLTDLAKAIGSRPYFMDTLEHDSYVAAASHLPLLLSVGLVRCTSMSPAWHEIAQVASTGFRDVTRLASGDPVMHKDICVTNGEMILGWIDRFVGELYEMRQRIEQCADGEGSDLREMFSEALYFREEWLQGRVTPGTRSLIQREDLPSFTESLGQVFLGTKGIDAYKRMIGGAKEKGKGNSKDTSK